MNTADVRPGCSVLFGISKCLRAGSRLPPVGYLLCDAAGWQSDGCLEIRGSFPPALSRALADCTTSHTSPFLRVEHAGVTELVPQQCRPIRWSHASNLAMRRCKCV